jgi:hypothetical protein
MEFRKRGNVFWNQDYGKWQRSDSQGIMEEVLLPLDGAKVKFVPELRNGKFKIEPGQSLRYYEVGGNRVLTEDELLRGEISESHMGLLWLNFLLNFFFLGLWFACLWLLLRFQWPHALGLALACWLVMTIPGSIVSTLLAKGRDAAGETAKERAAAAMLWTVLRHGDVPDGEPGLKQTAP